MRKLRHPIALFVVAVLVVIGIGVAVVGGLPTLTTYSLGGVQFAIDFPAVLLPQGDVGSKGVSCLYADAASSRGHLAVLVAVVEPGGCATTQPALSFNTAASFITNVSFVATTPLVCERAPSKGPSSSRGRTPFVVGPCSVVATW